MVEIGDSVLHIQFVGDKGSLLRGTVASRSLAIPRDGIFDAGRVLDEYLQESDQWDIAPSPRLGGAQPLFFCMDKKRSGLPLKSETVSHIFLRFLRRAGAETDVLARHLRSIVASSAYELGVSLRPLCLHCRWETASVFFNFYLRSGVERRLEEMPSSGEDGSVVPLVLFAAYRRDFPGHSQ